MLNLLQKTLKQIQEPLKQHNSLLQCLKQHFMREFLPQKCKLQVKMSKEQLKINVTALFDPVLLCLAQTEAVMCLVSTALGRFVSVLVVSSAYQHCHDLIFFFISCGSSDHLHDIYSPQTPEQLQFCSAQESHTSPLGKHI